MNKSQLLVLWIGIAFFILFGLFTQTSRGYETDYGPLTVRLLSTLLVTAGLIITLNKSDIVWKVLITFWRLIKKTRGKSQDDHKE